MDSLFTQNVLDEPEDIPNTQEPVWILGKRYNAIKGMRKSFFLFDSKFVKNLGNIVFLLELDAIRQDIRSKLWFTYRKGFVPIGGTGSTFTSDKGWGCMLRCGQMVLGQALVSLHLGIRHYIKLIL